MMETFVTLSASCLYSLLSATVNTVLLSTVNTATVSREQGVPTVRCCKLMTAPCPDCHHIISTVSMVSARLQ